MSLQGRLHFRHLQRPHVHVFSRRLCVSATASVKARWSFNAKFGHKQDALKLIREFVSEVSVQCPSLTKSQISHGAVGIPESNIELEIEFENLAEIESFWNSIPTDFQREWTEEMKPFIVDGSTQWTIHHILPITTPRPPILAESLSEILTPGDDQKAKELGEAFLATNNTKKEQDQSSQKRVIRDWKGDLLELNPGDDLPFNFTE